MIISIISLKGGVGKTTTALHLATVAALEGLPVTLLDADAESSALSWARFARENGGESEATKTNSQNMLETSVHQVEPWLLIPHQTTVKC
jgi:chromosome partitioning protein